MAVVIQSQASAKGSGSLVITKPSGVVSGDLLVAVLMNGGSATISAPAGWTAIREDTEINGTNQRIFYKVAGGSEGADYTFTASQNLTGVIFRIDGQAASSPINANGPSTGITPSIENCMLLICASAKGTSGAADVSGYAIATSNPTWTEKFNDGDFNSTILGVASATRPQTTATGNISVSFSSGFGNISAIIAIAPFPPPVQTLQLTVGSFTLTGISISLFRHLIAALSKGTFLLTGQSINVGKLYIAMFSAASFVVTRFTAIFTYSLIYTNRPKNNASPTNRTKHNASPSNRTKNSPSVTNREKS